MPKEHKYLPTVEQGYDVKTPNRKKLNTPPPPQILRAAAIFTKTTSTAYKKDSLFEGNPLVLLQRRSRQKKMASIC
jgi:hypothetical protein